MQKVVSLLFKGLVQRHFTNYTSFVCHFYLVALTNSFYMYCLIICYRIVNPHYSSKLYNSLVL